MPCAHHHHPAIASHTGLRPNLPSVLLLALACALPLAAHAGTTIDLSAEASRAANNDLARSTVFSESRGNTPAEVARIVNEQIADAFKLAKSYPSVKAQSGNTNTYPNYGKTSKIESWLMRSEITLESTDSVALSELLGKLQGRALGVSGIDFLPTAETRKKAESAALLDALDAFKALPDRLPMPSAAASASST